MTEICRDFRGSQHELVGRCHNWVMTASFHILIDHFALQISNCTRECQIFLTPSVYVFRQ